MKASSPGGGEEEEEEEEESIVEKMQEGENGGDVKESTTEMNVDSEQPPEAPDGTKGIKNEHITGKYKQKYFVFFYYIFRISIVFFLPLGGSRVNLLKLYLRQPGKVLTEN